MSVYFDKLSLNIEKKAFVVTGAGPKAFCAGGDVRALYDEILEADEESLGLSSLEYPCIM